MYVRKRMRVKRTRKKSKIWKLFAKMEHGLEWTGSIASRI